MVKFPFGYHKINQTMFNLLSISATFISISIFYLLRDILFPNLYLDNHQKEMIYIASSCMFIQILDNYLSAFIFSIFGKLSYFYLLDTFQNRVFMTTTTLLVFIFVRYIFNSYSNHIENTLLTK
jgi:hypothetical protein